MATYGYSTPYTGRGDTGPLPPGYMEAATAPGRNLAMGIAAMGQGLGKAIEQYRTKKAETEAATQSWETVSGLMQQQLASDPKYLAIQQYMETGALPQGVTEQDIPRYTQQVQADREMLNKFSALGEKFPDMSLAKKKAALGDAVMVLNQYRTDQQNQVRDAAARQQLALGALQLGKAQREAEGAPYFTQALIDLYARQPGQGPTAPYADVTQEVMDKYGGKLTQDQVQALIPLTRRIGQAIPAGMTALGATVGPEGTKVEYGLPPTVTSMPVPGTDLVQPMIGPKASGAPVPASQKIQSKIDELPEEKRKWANDTLDKLRANKPFADLESRANEFAALEKIAAKEKPSPADDIALIIRFNKTMDPAGAVLEGEFKRSVEGGSVSERVRQLYEYYTKGNRLTPEMRKDIVDSAKSIVDAYVPSVAGRINDEIVAAKYRGVPEDAVVPDSMLNFLKTKGNLPSLNKSQDSTQEGQTSGGVKYKVFKK
jgi:hypothetical protein